MMAHMMEHMQADKGSVAEAGDTPAGALSIS
jgi:hypothetical protein